MNDTKKLMSVLILLSILIASIFYLMHYGDGTEKKKEALSDVQGWNLREAGTAQYGYSCPLTSTNTTKKCRVWGEANCNTITSTAIKYSEFFKDTDVPKNPDGSLNGCSQYECTTTCGLSYPLVQNCGEILFLSSQSSQEGLLILWKIRKSSSTTARCAVDT